MKRGFKANDKTPWLFSKKEKRSIEEKQTDARKMHNLKFTFSAFSRVSPRLFAISFDHFIQKSVSESFMRGAKTVPKLLSYENR